MAFFRATLSLAVSLIVSVGAACARPPVDGVGGRRQVADLSQIEQRLIAAAVDSIAGTWRDSTALCLGILGGPAGQELPSADLLSMLRSRQQPVSIAACPRTYTSMIALVDSLGRPVDRVPRGYVDPYVLVVGRPQFDRADPGWIRGWIHVRESHGTAGRAYLCAVLYVRGTASARCDAVQYSIS